MYYEKKLEDKVRVFFPEFRITDEMNGLPTVIFAFLSTNLNQAILKHDEELINRFVQFVNELSQENDSITVSSLSEIFLGLYTESEIDYKEFKNALSETAQAEFQKNIDMWCSQYLKK